MLKKVRRLPSPALVISALALIVAVGGGTFAFATSDNAKDKKIAKKQANKQITKRAPGLSVNHANSATSANSATNATNATNANHANSADSATTAGTANSAFSTFHDGGIFMPDALGAAGNPIATLNVPQAGSYVINAKLEAFDASAVNDMSSAECTLTAGGDVDTQFFDATVATSDDQEDVPLQLVHSFGAAGTVTLRCTDFGAGLGEAVFTKITALQVAHLTNTGF